MAAASLSAAAARVTATVLVVCAIVLSLGTVGVFAATSAGDVSVLNQLATTWSTAKLNWQGDPCDNYWRGIICNTSTNPATVSELNLASSGLEGSLPAEIGGLTNLIILDLSRNRLVGEVPKELGQLTNLQSLSLQWCNFSGPIPAELSNLNQLTFLGLNGNNLTESIPSSFGLLKQLTWLDLSVNSLSGSIPVSTSPGSNGIGLDNMTTVRHFHFNDNLLSGSVPPEVFSPQDLIHIILDHNQLGPDVPGISNAQNLTILRLDNNRFSGNIPQEIGNLPKLENLNLQNNQFSGSLPDLSNLTSLQLLDVSNNQGLSVQTIPTWVTLLSNLRTLNLAQDNIFGPINSTIFGIPQLQSLNLSRNSVNGTLQFPDTSSQNLQWIDVANNSINGFSGQPQFNGLPIKNVQLMLEGNPLCSNPYVAFSEAITCGALGIVKQWFPTANTSCSNVDCKKGRMLNHKTCACAYPLEVQLILTAPTLSNLTGFIALDIESQIASRMTSGGFINLDQSQVVIDRGSSTDDVRYDLLLLFFPLVGSDYLSNQNETQIVQVLNARRISITYGPFQVPYNPFTASRTSRAALSAGVIAGIVVGSGILVLLVVSYAVVQKIRADRAVANHPFASWGAGNKELGEAPKLKGARWFSLSELKLATNVWNNQNEIGRGGYGKVYKGVLKSGEVVAIKRAQEGSMQGAAEFKNEIELLSRVHHRNLVGLVGFCYEGGEQALVYEFMSNGTVRDHLYGDLAEAPLSWQERLDLALGSARGIAYLHDHANPPIIHRDVKTANILLNERHLAKVADFGLSKLAPEEGEMRVYSKNVKGTMGYLDPEYYTSFKLTDRSDVYSFGVVLLELLTAKPPIVDGKYVVREVSTALERAGLSGIRPLLDPALQDLPDADLEAYLKIALKCVEETSDNRDSMTDVVLQLESLGAHGRDPNAGAQKSEIDFGSSKPLEKFDDPDEYFPSPPAAGDTEKEANNPDFQYSGNSNILGSSYRAVTLRLRSPRAAKRPFSPLFAES